MEKELDILLKSRKLILKIVDPMTLDQINKIPQGHRNTIAWNLAHLVVTQQLLCYTNSGQKSILSKEFIDTYKKGSKTERPISEEELVYIKEQLLECVLQTIADYQENKFGAYNAYETSVGIVLGNIGDALKFNNFHEGIHLGTILAQRKMV